MTVKEIEPTIETPSQILDTSRVATIILGGGEGTRLFPLTFHRCKPAIPFGGCYRLIDIPVSMAINSQCNKIYILTQYLSTSLHQHVSRAFQPFVFQNGAIEILAPEHKPDQQEWFQGTADAVRQSLEYFVELPVDYFLILSGDHLYRMDFRDMLKFAFETQAEVVVATLPVKADEAKDMGIIKKNKNHLVTDFFEKPKDEKILDKFEMQNKPNQYLASMGIYLFQREALFDLLQNDLRDDFGSHLLPSMVKKRKVYAFQHKGYWKDVGTIKAFHKANIGLTKSHPAFRLFHESSPIYTFRGHLPPPRIINTKFKNAIISHGSYIEAEEIKNSIIGPRSVIRKNTKIFNSYIMGNEYYKRPPMPTEHLPDKLEIGEGVTIENAIVDKDVYIGKGATLVNRKKLDHYDSENVYIRDGIIIITRGAYIPDGFTL